jgi:hypothetical protein
MYSMLMFAPSVFLPSFLFVALPYFPFSFSFGGRGGAGGTFVGAVEALPLPPRTDYQLESVLYLFCHRIGLSVQFRQT